jgi:hypothetical protein
MQDKYGNIKTLLIACCLRDSMPQTTEAIPYRHKLKNITNQFITLYNQDVTPQLVKMYYTGENDKTFDLITSLIDQIASEICKADIQQLPLLLSLLKAFNNGEIKVEDDAKTDQT